MAPAARLSLGSEESGFPLSTCRYGEACRFSHDVERPAKRQRGPSQPPPPPSRPSLLNKLLAKEIRVEHSLLLQSIRRLVQSLDEAEAAQAPAAAGSSTSFVGV